jgi:hypothetical protein
MSASPVGLNSGQTRRSSHSNGDFTPHPRRKPHSRRRARFTLPKISIMYNSH